MMADKKAKVQAAGGSTVSRTIDYLFGSNALIAMASIMLLVISGFATWSGMNDFIIGTSQSPTKGTQVTEGFSVSHHSLVIFITVALTFLMWLSLRESIRPGRTFVERMVTWPLYLFLALWSIGFGYGFWWSLIAGEEATRTSMSALQEDARDATSSISARLDAVRAQVDSFVSWSESQMAREESSGGSCGTPSGAGRGPLYNARRSTRDSVASLRDTIANSWLGPVNTELDQLRKVTGAIEGATADERQRRFEAMAAQVRGSARNIASRSNELGRSTAAELRALAESVSVAPGQPGFSCYDPTLAQRLRQAADQAAVPAEITLRQAEFSEGPAGVANAVKNLWANFGAYTYGAFAYVLSGGTSTGTTTTGEPISGRDMIALLASVGIDLGLFVLALLSPPSAMVRRDALADTQARLHLATGPVVRQIEGAIQTAISRAPDADIEWVRQHFIHHNGSSYFVIPNLYSAAEKGEHSRKEELRALAMNQLAGVFVDLKLVRALTPKELQEFGREEQRYSYSDLTPYRADVGRSPAAAGGLFGGLLGRRKAPPADGGAAAKPAPAAAAPKPPAAGGPPKPAGDAPKPAGDAPKPAVVAAPKPPGDAPAAKPAPVVVPLPEGRTELVRSGAVPKKRIRNHGLLSKAQRTLDIAGWTPEAQEDVEIFRLVDQDGLTPLLAVLNQATLQPREGAGAASAGAGPGAAPASAAPPKPVQPAAKPQA
jgi:hypothetical protein